MKQIFNLVNNHQDFKKKISEKLRKIPFIKTLFFIVSLNNDLKWHHKSRDVSENKRTSLPKNEELHFHCVWVSEVYTPSTIDSLQLALNKLNWDYSEKPLGQQDSLINWVKNSRNSTWGGAWINGGFILNKNDKQSFLGANVRRANLPKGVSNARLQIHNIVSSLTVVTIQFILDERMLLSLNEPFNKEYKTYIKFKPSFWRIRGASYIDVVHQKQKQIEAQRQQIHQNLFSWFRKNIPGYFSNNDELEFPCIDFIVAEEYKSLRKNSKRIRDHYTDLLFGYGSIPWKAEDNQNLELRFDWNYLKKKNISLFGNQKKLMKGSEAYGGGGREGLMYKMNDSIQNNAVLWTVHHLIIDLESRISQIRDKSIFQIKGTGEALKNLKYITNQFSPISVDISIVGNDVLELVDSKKRYSYDAIDFKPPSFLKDVTPTFLELLRVQSQMRIKRLTKLESSVNSSLSANGSLVSAVANLRIQNYVLFLTIITIALTVFSFLQNDPMLYEIKAEIIVLKELIIESIAK
jgi:hypothetical protein